MGGTDMAALLMNDDSSSGESDTEDLKNVPASTSAVAAAIQPTSSPTPPQQQQKQQQQAAPAPAPAPTQPPPQNQPPPTNKSELSQRLKSLYSPASHASKKVAPAPAPPPSQPQQQPPASQSAPPPTRPPAHSTSTTGRPPHHPHHPGAPPTQPPQSSQSSHHMPPSQTQMQRQSSQSTRGVPPGSRGAHPGQPGYSSSSSQQPHYSSHHSSSQSSSQPPYSQPPSYGRTSSTQHRPPSSGGRPPSSSQQPPSSSSSSHRSASGGVPNPVPGHGSVPVAGQRRGNVSSQDPFEPTPLAKIRDREQKAMAAVAAHRSGPSSSSSGYPGGSGSSHTGSSRVPTSGATSEREKEMRRQKERFLMFTRVLMKYLETKDPSLHSKVKQIIKECAERNKRQEPGYESVTASMRERLKQVVGDAYWKRAESYLAHFLAQKQKQNAGGSASSSAAKGGSVDPQQRAAEMKRRQELDRKQRMEQQQRERQRMHEQQRQQQQQQQQQVPPQPAAAQQPPSSSAPQPVPQQTPQPTSSAQQQQQSAAAPTAKPARTASTATGGKGGKRAAGGGKQVGGKTGKKARTKSATTGSGAGSGGRGSKSASNMAQSPLAGQQSPSGQSAQAMPGTPNPMANMMESTRPPSPPPVREYSELMEEVEHSVHFDWTAAGLIMGSNLQRLQLQEEQKNLLYGSTATYNSASAKQQQTAQTPASPYAARTTEDGKTPFALRGWGKRNVVSPRVAWCRVRRREQPSEQHKAKLKQLYADSRVPTPASAWVNEDKAEEDAALCLLSEATQVYITQVLQKALVCARQRQNLDGIRLWHQQCTAAMEHAKSKKDGENGGGGDGKKFDPPPLSIKLGCDVTRQVARTAGNSALTSKRMEEALGRSKTHELTRVIPSKDGFQMDEATFMSASSMGELSLLPPLGNAVDKADYEAKRQFEIYGGKHAHEPPFGRVPKKAKLEAADFQRGLEINHFLGGRQGRRHRANPTAFSWNVKG